MFVLIYSKIINIFLKFNKDYKYRKLLYFFKCYVILLFYIKLISI